MVDFFRSIVDGVRDLIARNPVAGYLMAFLLLAAIGTMFYYLFNALKSSYLKWLAPFGQTLPLPLLVLLQNEIREIFGSEFILLILLVLIFYLFLTSIIHTHLTQIEAGKSSTGKFLIIFLGFVGIILWVLIIANLFYDTNLPETSPPPPTRP